MHLGIRAGKVLICGQVACFMLCCKPQAISTALKVEYFVPNGAAGPAAGFSSGGCTIFYRNDWFLSRVVFIIQKMILFNQNFSKMKFF